MKNTNKHMNLANGTRRVGIEFSDQELRAAKETAIIYDSQSCLASFRRSPRTASQLVSHYEGKGPALSVASTVLVRFEKLGDILGLLLALKDVVDGGKKGELILQTL